ncbi:hypothetical protein [Peptostreptococcus sp.]|jgi:hypothetical protein|uniref:hypothetical protein n=1 Tax=Peptostreptococcus sp. TaxID=1262 RepID=UPI001CAE144D|nr:hypothetical protein [Peptostreptococcus sp.]MBF1044554.1 hypothetical protein [Peptostreptococcus sp.]MBF1045261.1 hypothetical protein [Peptostreptococcus sp.]
MKYILKRGIPLFLILAYLLLNLAISYIALDTFIILLSMVLAFIAGLFLNNGAIRINIKQKILIFVLAILVEGIILLISAFIFESGYVLTPKQSLWETNRLISLYSIIGVLIIQDLLEYIVSKIMIDETKNNG